MGLSGLLILFCHSIAYIKVPMVIHYAVSFANIGVDLFLFLSGMGLWYSLSRSDSSLLKWYANRYTKLLVPYLVVVLSIEIIQFVLGKQLEDGIWNYLFGISSLRFYVSHDAPWFIAALIPLYLFAPWFYRLIKKYKWKAVIALVVLHYVILFIPPEFASELANNVIKNIQFVAVRATCFILGMALGHYVKEGKNISIKWLIYAVIMGGAIIAITSHLVYGYFFFTLPLLYILCYVLKKSGEPLKHFSHFMGKISLESYILNGALPKMIITGFVTLNLPTINNVIPYAISCVVGTLLAYIFHKISNKIINSISYVKKGNY